MTEGFKLIEKIKGMENTPLPIDVFVYECPRCGKRFATYDKAENLEAHCPKCKYPRQQSRQGWLTNYRLG